MGLLRTAFYGFKMVERYMPSIKDLTEKLVNKYASTIEPEEWTDKVADVEIDDLSYKEKQDSMAIALQTAELASGQCDNLAQAIQDDPVRWGQYLQEKGMDAEKLEEIKEKEGDSIPPLDLIKLTMDGGSKSEPEADGPSVDSKTAENQGTMAGMSEQEKAELRVSQAAGAGIPMELTDMPTTADLNFEAIP